LGQQIKRDVRCIAERFIVRLDERRDHLVERTALHAQLVMIEAQQRRNAAGLGEFVNTVLVVKADGVTGEAPPARNRRRGGNTRGIHTTAQKYTHWDVAHQLSGNCAVERDAHRARCLTKICELRSTREPILDLPPSFGAALAICDDESIARLECPHRAVYGTVLKYAAVPQIFREALIIQSAIELDPCEHGLDFRPKGEATAAQGIEEWLDSEPVPHQHEPPPFSVPQAKRENSFQACKSVHTPCVVGVQEDFRVRMTTEHSTRCLEFAAQLTEVVALAVIDDSRRSETHRLSPGR